MQAEQDRRGNGVLVKMQRRVVKADGKAIATATMVHALCRSGQRVVKADGMSIATETMVHALCRSGQFEEVVDQ